MYTASADTVTQLQLFCLSLKCINILQPIWLQATWYKLSLAAGLNSFVKIPPAGGKSGGVLDIFFVEKNIILHNVFDLAYILEGKHA